MSRLPNAVMTTTGAGPMRLRNSAMADSPSMPGKRTSSTTASGGPSSASLKPSSAEAATSTWCPSSVRNSRNAQQMLASSSTIRMRLMRLPLRLLRLAGATGGSGSRGPPGSRRACPPCRVATCWARASPSPTPSGLLVANGSNSDSASPGGGPGPVSLTSMATVPPSWTASSRTVPPCPAASMAFRVRFKAAARSPDSSADHFERCPIAPEVERDLRVLARGADQEGDVAEEPPEVAHRRRPALDAAEREEPLDLLLGHGELPQCDVQALVARRGGEPPRVELDAHPRPRERIPQLVGEARRELGEEPRPLRLLDRPLHVPQLVAHAIDRTREVRDLVSLAAGVEPLEVARRRCGPPGG